MVNVIVVDGEAEDYEEAIRCGAGAMLRDGFVKSSFADACIEREKIYPTGLPTPIPVAIPHTDAEHVKEDCVCFLRLHKPVAFTRMDMDESIDCRLVVNMALGSGKKQVTMLAVLMKLLQNETLVTQCMERPGAEVRKMLEQKLNKEEAA